MANTWRNFFLLANLLFLLNIQLAKFFSALFRIPFSNLFNLLTFKLKFFRYKKYAKTNPI